VNERKLLIFIALRSLSLQRLPTARQLLLLLVLLLLLLAPEPVRPSWQQLPPLRSAQAPAVGLWRSLLPTPPSSSSPQRLP
jgi:hypothetical protein